MEFNTNESLELSRLLNELEKVNYPAFGFGSVTLFRLTGKDEQWKAILRNPTNYKDMPKFEGNTPLEAVKLIYAYCVEQKYLII